MPVCNNCNAEMTEETHEALKGLPREVYNCSRCRTTLLIRISGDCRYELWKHTWNPEEETYAEFIDRNGSKGK